MNPNKHRSPLRLIWSLRWCRASHLACCLLLACLASACSTTTTVINTFERDELIAVRHNQQNDCTLLIYRDPLGQTRHVFRRSGIFELALTFVRDGSIELIERGGRRRTLTSPEAGIITRHILEFMQVRQEQSSTLSSI